MTRVRRWTALVAGVLCVTASLVPLPAGAGAPTVERIAGRDRYETAALVAERFPAGREVYVATGENFPDSLAAGPALGTAQLPILLVMRDSIPDVTRTELQRLQPSQIMVVGGTAAISDAVLGSLRGFTTGPVVRLAGADRYGTAIAIDENAFTSGVKRLDVVTGRDFPDALLAGAAGSVSEHPILLVDGQSPLTPEEIGEIKRLAPERILVDGDAAAISADVESELAQLGPVVRASESVYERAQQFWQNVSPEAGWEFILVTGANFPDGLAAAAFAGLYPGRLTYMVRPDCIPPSVADDIARLQPPHITLIGGPAALSDNVANLVRCGS